MPLEGTIKQILGGEEVVRPGARVEHPGSMQRLTVAGENSLEKRRAGLGQAHVHDDTVPVWHAEKPIGGSAPARGSGPARRRR